MLNNQGCMLTYMKLIMKFGSHIPYQGYFNLKVYDTLRCSSDLKRFVDHIGLAMFNTSSYLSHISLLEYQLKPNQCNAIFFNYMTNG